jgi:hypothetical protein
MGSGSIVMLHRSEMGSGSIIIVKWGQVQLLCYTANAN